MPILKSNAPMFVERLSFPLTSSTKDRHLSSKTSLTITFKTKWVIKAQPRADKKARRVISTLTSSLLISCLSSTSASRINHLKWEKVLFCASRISGLMESSCSLKESVKSQIPLSELNAPLASAQSVCRRSVHSSLLCTITTRLSKTLHLRQFSARCLSRH